MVTTAKLPKEVGRLVRFGIVGLSGTLLDFLVLTFLKEAAGFTTLLANTLSYSVGLINNFTWNRLWTYPDSRSKPLLTQLSQFAMVSLMGVMINNLIVLMLEPSLGALIGNPEIGYLPAKVVATGVVVFWNFIVNRLWTFNDIQ